MILTGLIHPEERRHEFTRESWDGEGFRHYLDPRVYCLEHYIPQDKSILRGTLPAAWLGPARLIGLGPPLIQAISDTYALWQRWA